MVQLNNINKLVFLFILAKCMQIVFVLVAMSIIIHYILYIEYYIQ